MRERDTAPKKTRCQAHHTSDLIVNVFIVNASGAVHSTHHHHQETHTKHTQDQKHLLMGNLVPALAWYTPLFMKRARPKSASLISRSSPTRQLRAARSLCHKREWSRDDTSREQTCGLAGSPRDKTCQKQSDSHNRAWRPHPAVYMYMVKTLHQGQMQTCYIFGRFIRAQIVKKVAVWHKLCDDEDRAVV